MNDNTELPWGQPWNFLFNKGVDESTIKQELSDIGQRLYDYVEKSLGGNEYFSLQINCSQAIDDELHYQMYANLIVMKEAVIKWKKLNEVAIKTRILENPLEIIFDFNPGYASMAGSKPPPPPPPPPPRAVEMLGDAPPFRYLSNQFVSSHVLNFSREGVLSQFNVKPLALSVEKLTK